MITFQLKGNKVVSKLCHRHDDTASLSNKMGVKLEQEVVFATKRVGGLSKTQNGHGYNVSGVSGTAASSVLT